MSVKKKRKAKSPKSGRIAQIQASAAGGAKRPRELPPSLARLYRPVKKPVTLRLDADVIEWFKAGGRGYQTRINRALREVIKAEQDE